ncbi:aldehyde dehydrogenase (NADP(+)) [Chitinophaga sp. 22321]|uniref:Aldehyde dehydrogenase (NADP(+)) n=1 Tax=Chitinophaga hostae TaxID=2831022 RepID=A0ABS5J7L0_9BACT|nr:aldehyde dehydrogenase (NADP(+)) [Chitinophaga hostae]MBS0031071.1 aldehyde dehydrogenase (NADP(+)) [Chitinophaga hostae]
MSRTLITGLQLIGNNFSGEGDDTFRAFDPRQQQWLPQEFREATTGEIDAALNLAAKAFPLYKKTTAAQRAAFLEAIADDIVSLGDELINVASAESGLPLPRLQGERDRTTGQLRLFANTIKEGSWVNARINTGTPDVRQMQIPIGVTGIFGASNFPLAFSVAGGDTAAALAAGCPVVFKAHPAHPHTSYLVATAIRKAILRTQMPEGVFSMVHGTSHETGQYLAAHPIVSAIAFTGSFRGGKALYETATRRAVPIPVYAEMGSVNPVFFLPGILREKGPALAMQLLQSVTLGVGQFCTNPGMFITPSEDAAAAFISALQQGIGAMSGGPMLTPGILDAYHNGIRLLQQTGAAVLGAAPDTAQQATPYLLQVSAEKALENPAICHEVFGPSSLHIHAGSIDELYQVARKLEGQLTATIHGTEADLQQHADLVDILREKAGRIIINGFPTGVAVNQSMVHGGPWPATTPAAGTSVGTAAIYRFCRPVCYQDFPAYLLPPELQDSNPMHIWRLVNGDFSNTQK